MPLDSYLIVEFDMLVLHMLGPMLSVSKKPSDGEVQGEYCNNAYIEWQCIRSLMPNTIWHIVDEYRGGWNGYAILLIDRSIGRSLWTSIPMLIAQVCKLQQQWEQIEIEKDEYEARGYTQTQPKSMRLELYMWRGDTQSIHPIWKMPHPARSYDQLESDLTTSHRLIEFFKRYDEVWKHPKLYEYVQNVDKERRICGMLNWNKLLIFLNKLLHQDDAFPELLPTLLASYADVIMSRTSLLLDSKDTHTLFQKHDWGWMQHWTMRQIIPSYFSCQHHRDSDHTCVADAKLTINTVVDVAVNNLNPCAPNKLRMLIRKLVRSAKRISPAVNNVTTRSIHNKLIRRVPKWNAPLTPHGRK